MQRELYPPLPEFNLSPVLDNLHQYIKIREGFQLLGTIIDTTIALVHHHHTDKTVFASGLMTSLPSTFAHLLWRNLDPDRAAHHVESVDLYLVSHFISSNYIN